MIPRCTLTATLNARPEKRAELIELLESFVGPSRSEPGCVDYHFHVSADDPNVFYFYEIGQRARISIVISSFRIRRTGSRATKSFWRRTPS